MKAGDLVLYRVRSADKRSTGEGMRVLCEVKEVREVFGRQDLLIAPVSGEGELRVSAGSVEAAAEAIAKVNWPSTDEVVKANEAMITNQEKGQ